MKTKPIRRARTATKCRVCGCSDAVACIDANGMPCYWIEPGLCSRCWAEGERPRTRAGKALARKIEEALDKARAV